MLVEIVIAALIVLGFLAGVRLMQAPATALWGNRLGALCMVLAVIFTLILLDQGWNNPGLWLLFGAGTVLGLALGQRVKMIQMPQAVALLNGLGGAASALVAVSAVAIPGGVETVTAWFTAALALAVGTVTFSGSMIAVLKLGGAVSPRPVMLPGHRTWMGVVLAAGIFLIAAVFYLNELSLYLIIPVFFIYGLLMALRVGGADMPIIISLLNSFSGVAAAVCGLAVGNLLLAGVGALVGVAGMILTGLMCRAMNRSLAAVMAGFGTAAQFKASPGEELPPDETADPAARLPAVLKQSKTVIIVPGYGMAVAQAQRAVKELIDRLEQKGKEVRLAIHPVAGRMPGHMNVLLAEVGIPYEKLHDLETINPAFTGTDLVIVVGACDVVNPAANTAEGTPIYGMPILEVARARHVIVCNLDRKPGYSGVDNTLYREKHVLTLWGNAAETVPRLSAMLE